MSASIFRKAKLDGPVLPPPLPTKLAETDGFSLLNLEEADRLADMLLFAKTQVEGYFSGRHKSPHRGSDVEFAEHQEYVSGQDIGKIDWRVYGRTKRLYVREYKEETDMVAYLVVDTSGSMNYKGRGLETKFHHARKIAAILAYLMLRQGDKAALTLFADRLQQHLPPGGTRRHLHHLLSELEVAKPSSHGTDLAGAMRQCASLYRKRGGVVVLSDFLGDTTGLFDALGYFLHRRYDVLLMQILDPDERDLPDVSIAQFIDMETGDRIEVEPEEIRAEYQGRMEALIADLGQRASRRHLRHALVETSNPYLQAIEAWLSFRGGVRG